MTQIYGIVFKIYERDTETHACMFSSAFIRKLGTSKNPKIQKRLFKHKADFQSKERGV